VRNAPIGSPSARVTGSACASSPECARPAAIGSLDRSHSIVSRCDSSARSSGNACPAPSTTASSASGIRRASSRALASGVIASCSPCITSVGAWIWSSRDTVSW
jgi:hypothetical protein